MFYPDLSNTHLAMEALFYAKKPYQNKEGDIADLDWDAAISLSANVKISPLPIVKSGLAIMRKTGVVLSTFQVVAWLVRGKIQMAPLHYGHMGA